MSGARPLDLPHLLRHQAPEGNRLPADCVYLGNAEAHPPAVVQRQRERDLPMLVQMIEGLTAQQGEALSLLQARIRMHRAAAIPPLRDSDVADAMKALASTLETAARGILYEHQAVSVPAMRLQQDLRAVLAELGEHERALGPAALAPVLRRIETMVQRAGRHFAPASDTVFLDFLERVGRPLAEADGTGRRTRACLLDADHPAVGLDPEHPDSNSP